MDKKMWVGWMEGWSNNSDVRGTIKLEGGRVYMDGPIYH